MALDELGTGQGYLKAGFLGFQKSGKSWTAIALGIQCWKFFGSKGRLVFFDTEGGSEYVAGMVRRLTGRALLGKRTRAFADLMTVTRDLQEDDIFIVDSITHPWRELCESHLASVNKMRAKKNLPPRAKLEFQDYSALKQKWSDWTDFYLNSRVHIIICGRAGFEYEMETNEETNKKELVKTGVKMKTESEFGFEPSLLVEMERQQMLGDKTEIVHHATVIGDRFNVIDGKQISFRGGLAEAKAVEAVFEFFKPHIALLMPGGHAPIDTALKTDTGVTEDGDAEWQRERRTRTILCEEIQGEIVAHIPGQSAEDKKAKSNLLLEIFGTRSWSAVENMDSEALRKGLERTKAHFGTKRDNLERATGTSGGEPEAKSLEATASSGGGTDTARPYIPDRDVIALVQKANDLGWKTQEFRDALRRIGIENEAKIPQERLAEIDAMLAGEPVGAEKRRK